MPPSDLERALAFQIRAKGLQEPLWEFRAIPRRRYRFDAAWTHQRLLVEVQGGIWKPGGHSTGNGITRDCEKLNLAVLAGWRVLHVTAEHIKSGQAIRWIEEALRHVPEGVESN